MMKFWANFAGKEPEVQQMELIGLNIQQNNLQI